VLYPVWRQAGRPIGYAVPNPPQYSRQSRRDLLKKAAIGGAAATAVWAAPTVVGVASAGTAPGTEEPPPTTTTTTTTTPAGCEVSVGTTGVGCTDPVFSGEARNCFPTGSGGLTFSGTIGGGITWTAVSGYTVTAVKCLDTSSFESPADGTQSGLTGTSNCDPCSGTVGMKWWIDSV
jgi:hypothetical protein